jgi:hypothetical protein
VIQSGIIRDLQECAGSEFFPFKLDEVPFPALWADLWLIVRCPAEPVAAADALKAKEFSFLLSQLCMLFLDNAQARLARNAGAVGQVANLIEFTLLFAAHTGEPASWVAHQKSYSLPLASRKSASALFCAAVLRRRLPQ